MKFLMAEHIHTPLIGATDRPLKMDKLNIPYQEKLIEDVLENEKKHP
jgi:hypothetical protein